MKNTDKKQNPYARLLSYLRPYRGSIILAIVMIFLGVLAQTLAPLMMGEGINRLGSILKGAASDDNGFLGFLLAMIVCYDGSRCWTRPFDGKSSGDVDGSIVTTHLTLAAADLGLGSTWVMYFKPDAVKAEFALPEGIEPVAILPMGYPADDAAPSPKHGESRPMEDMAEFV